METVSLAIVLAAVSGGLAYLVTGWYYWRHRHVHGLDTLTFTAVFSGMAAIVYGAAVAVGAPGPSRWLYGLYLGLLFAGGMGWYAFALQWTGRFSTSHFRALGLLAAAYALVLSATIYEALVVRVDGSEATIAAIETTTIAGTRVPHLVPGPLWLGVDLVMFGLFFATVGLLLKFALKPEQRLYRQQNLLLPVAATGAMIVELVIELLAIPIEGVPLTSLPVSIVVGVAVFRYGVFNASPIARRSLVEELDAGILAYDNAGRVIDANPLVRSLLGAADDLVGTDVETVLSTSPLDIEFEDGDGRELAETIEGREFVVDRDGRSRYFAAQTSTVEADGGQPVARALLFSDITEQRLRERERDMLKQVFSRVLRHNLRNEMNVIRGAAEELAERTDEPEADLARRIVTTSGSLVDISEKARLVEKVVERSTERTTVDLVGTVEEVIEEMTTRFPTATFETDLPADLTVVAHPALDVAIENAVENAVEHGSTSHADADASADAGRASSSEPSGANAPEDAVEHGSTSPPSYARQDAEHGTVTVSIAASVEEEQCILEISDDGPGIPEAELAPLDEQAETPLQHASGVGLWLIQWVTTRSDGEISFESSDEGTTVRMTLEVQTATVEPSSEPESESAAPSLSIAAKQT